MESVEIISRVPLFEGLPNRYLTELAEIAVDQEFRKGWSLFLEGARATGFYVIGSGRVKIAKLSLEGKEQILHIFGPGEFFGEVPVFAGGSYPANAETLDQSRLLFFPREAFIGLVAKEPALALNMLAILCQRLRRFTHLVEDLSLKEVPSRLAAYLLFLAGSEKNEEVLELDITKGQLAGLLGTIPETLSRILARMSALQLIRVEGRKITILERDALRNLAEGDKLIA